jgi:DNA-binding CsgD family transcriptional regulator
MDSAGAASDDAFVPGSTLTTTSVRHRIPVLVAPAPSRALGRVTRRRAEQGGASGPSTVTENQRAILLRLFAGEDEKRIAADTGRTLSTISNTVRRVRDQLGGRTEYDLMRECLRRGIVSLEEVYALADTVPRPPSKSVRQERKIVRRAQDS